VFLGPSAIGDVWLFVYLAQVVRNYDAGDPCKALTDMFGSLQLSMITAAIEQIAICNALLLLLTF
jgi:hypothetical protein